MGQPRRIPGNVTANPWEYRAEDYQGNAISITFPWDNTTRALTGATATRDVGCVYDVIYVGFGADGKVESSTRKISLKNFTGSKSFTATQLAAVGLNTIDDILSLQITAAT
jgi:hypothetical protein